MRRIITMLRRWNQRLKPHNPLPYWTPLWAWLDPSDTDATLCICVPDPQGLPTFFRIKELVAHFDAGIFSGYSWEVHQGPTSPPSKWQPLDPL